MVSDRQKVRTDGRTEWTDGRTDDAKTISLRLRRGIKNSIQTCPKNKSIRTHLPLARESHMQWPLTLSQSFRDLNNLLQFSTP